MRRYHISGLCPYGLFTNTKWDLGPCGFKWHEDRLQEDFLAQPVEERDKLGYEWELLKVLKELVRECDRKVEKAHERAAVENAPKDLTPEEQMRINDMDVKVAEITARAAALAEQGDIDGSEEATKEADALKARRDEEKKRLIEKNNRGRGILEVCPISGASLLPLPLPLHPHPLCDPLPFSLSLAFCIS